MGRNKTTNRDLPMRMQKKGGSYYYVCKGSWTPLGQNKARALHRWADLESHSHGITVAQLVQRYIDNLECADRTRIQYQSYQRAIARDLDVSARALTAHHLALWRDGRKQHKSYTNGCLALLIATWNAGREWGLVDADISVKKLKEPPREITLSDDEFRAIRSVALPWMRVAMDIGYLAAPRPVDIRKMLWADVRDGLIYMRANKTGQRQAFRLTPELETVLAEARSRPILGLYVIASQKGRPITVGQWAYEWNRARAAAGVSDTKQFRDIRPKAALASEDDGADPQKLLGHRNRAMTDHYLRGRKTVVADPVKRKL